MLTKLNLSKLEPTINTRTIFLDDLSEDQLKSIFSGKSFIVGCGHHDIFLYTNEKWKDAVELNNVFIDSVNTIKENLSDGEEIYYCETFNDLGVLFYNFVDKNDKNDNGVTTNRIELSDL